MQFIFGFVFAVVSPPRETDLKFFFSKSDNGDMVQELDLYFPYIVMVYGAIMTWVTHSEKLRKVADQSMSPELVHWFYGHRILGTICLLVGSLWSIQRVFI